MNVRVESKRKAHLDPYGRGERPEKKAKPDARSPALGLGPLRTPAAWASSSQYPSAPSMPFAQLQPPPASILSILSQRGILMTTNIPSFLLPTLPVVTQLDPATFNLQNKFALHSLKRARLNQLCSHYKVKANGTNKAVISRLEACIPPSLPALGLSS